MIRIIIGYIMLYFVIMLGSTFISYKTKKSLSSSISIDILTNIAVLYVFGLFNILLIGVITTSVISILLGIYALVKMNKTQRNTLVDFGTIFFSIVYFVLSITTYERISNIWDEFTCWSLFTKKMFITNIYETDWYPPVPTIWQYYCCKLIGNYTQGIEMFGLYIFSFSLLLPLFNIKKEKSLIYNLALSIIIICLPGIFSETYFYEAPYADAILGLLLGYIFVERIFNTKYTYSLVVALFVLALTKGTGFYIAITTLICFFAYDAIKQIRNKEKIDKKKCISKIIIFLLILSSLASWNIYKNLNITREDNINIISESKLDETGIKKFITSFFTASMKTTSSSLMADMIQDNLITMLIKGSLINSYIQLSIGGFTLLLAFGFVLLYKKNNKAKNVSIYTFGGLILYIGFLQLAYFTKFNMQEALTHNSFSRYMSSYYIAMLMTFIALVIDSKSADYKRDITVLMIIILALTPLKDIANITINSGFYNYKMKKELSTIIEETNKLKQEIPANSKIYVINQQLEDNKFKYYMLPENNVEMGIYFGNNFAQNEKEQFENILYNTYDYVYIRATDDYFNNNYQELFNEKIEKKATYKVIKDNGKENLKLERIDINE
jgi:hypothetical protein